MPMRLRFTTALGALFLILALVASPAFAKSVIDFNPDLDFSKYKTFAYIGGVEHLTQQQVNPYLIRDTVHAAVAKALVERGLVEVGSQNNPDLVVRYRAESATQVNYSGDDMYGGYSAYTVDWWAWSYTLWMSSTTRDGSLMIDLIDTKRRGLAWRLYLQQKILNVDKMPEKITNEITEGFKSFPPTEKDKEEMRKEHAKHDKEKPPKDLQFQ
ncbi:MAG TPA: DUF4136 domain-containing protein [Methylomirabilota bacterium]|nr:DUF4136 domain-containing protein [Methylomirabilota bacterium]